MLNLLIIHKGPPLILNSFFIDFHCLNLGTPQPEGRGPPMLTQSSHNSTIIDTFIYTSIVTRLVTRCLPRRPFYY